MTRLSDEKLVKDLLDIERGLTDWEVEFVESIHRQLKRGDRRYLSQKQREVADSIHNKFYPDET